jgi:hypothetical protein
MHPDWAGYSLLGSDGRPRPSYDALATMNRSSNIRRFAQRIGAWARDLRAQLSPKPAQALAPDAVVHLGDSDFSEPWMPLYGARNPSTVWAGTVYVQALGQRSWRLTLQVCRAMCGAIMWVNGLRLDPQFRSRISADPGCRVGCAAGILTRANECLRSARALPLLQAPRLLDCCSSGPSGCGRRAEPGRPPTFQIGIVSLRSPR